jgi:hypothetical protein
MQTSPYQKLFYFISASQPGNQILAKLAIPEQINLDLAPWVGCLVWCGWLFFVSKKKLQILHKSCAHFSLSLNKQ